MTPKAAFKAETVASNEEDIRAAKSARSLMAKRGIDASRCDIRVTHSTCYIKGLVAKIGGVAIPDLEAEMENIVKVLRGKPEIREVIVEVSYKR